MISFAKDIGVPTAIAFYVLLRIEPKLESIRDLLQTLPSRLEKLRCPYDQRQPPNHQDNEGDQ